MGRHFEVMYWGYNNDDAIQMTELRRAVTIPPKTMDSLTDGKHVDNYTFICDDGELWILPRKLFCELREVTSFD